MGIMKLPFLKTVSRIVIANSRRLQTSFTSSEESYLIDPPSAAESAKFSPVIWHYANGVLINLTKHFVSLFQGILRKFNAACEAQSSYSTISRLFTGNKTRPDYRIIPSAVNEVSERTFYHGPLWITNRSRHSKIYSRPSGNSRGKTLSLFSFTVPYFQTA